MRLRVAPDAEEELTEAAEWYEARRDGLGVELVAVVDGALDAIVTAPLAHPLWKPDRPYRKKVFLQFPYVIFFRCEAGCSDRARAQATGLLARSHARLTQSPPRAAFFELRYSYQASDVRWEVRSLSRPPQRLVASTLSPC